VPWQPADSRFSHSLHQGPGGSRDPSRPARGRAGLILSDREGGEIAQSWRGLGCHAVRTAAAATVACRLLARKGAATMAMLGPAIRPGRRSRDGEAFR